MWIMDAVDVIGWVAMDDAALAAAGFRRAEFGLELQVGAEALVLADGRWQRGVVTRKGITMFDVAYVTDRAVRDARMLADLAREAAARGVDPATDEWSWCADIRRNGLRPLVTVARVGVDQAMVRHSGAPWSPLNAPENSGAVQATPGGPQASSGDQGASQERHGGEGIQLGSVVTFTGNPSHFTVQRISQGYALTAPVGGGKSRWSPLGMLRLVAPVDMLDPDPEIVRCWVLGTPRPKGSLKPIVRAAGGGRVKVAMVEQSTGSKSWRKAVENALKVAYPYALPTLLPVDLELVCVVQRPESSQRPEVIDSHFGDLDKLIRNIGDAAEGSGVLGNDRQIVGITSARKVWAPTGHPEGAWIIIREAR